MRKTLTNLAWIVSGLVAIAATWGLMIVVLRFVYL